MLYEDHDARGIKLGCSMAEHYEQSQLDVKSQETLDELKGTELLGTNDDM